MPATCDLYDRFGEAARVVRWPLLDLGGRMAFGGRVVTVTCHEDNSAIKELSGRPGAGQVLVADGGGSLRCALVGDMIAADFASNGWAGVVIFAAVRDRAQLRGIDLGVKAMGVTPRKSVRRGGGTVGLSLTVGGISIDDGDMLFADEDGIVVLTTAQALDLGEPLRA